MQYDDTGGETQLERRNLWHSKNKIYLDMRKVSKTFLITFQIKMGLMT